MCSNPKIHFKIGTVYRVEIEHTHYGEHLKIGELLTYCGSAWSRYDECSSYRFMDDQGRIRTFELYDSDKDIEMSSHFRKV
jgi:hypothetical protein